MAKLRVKDRRRRKKKKEGYKEGVREAGSLAQKRVSDRVQLADATNMRGLKLWIADMFDTAALWENVKSHSLSQVATFEA